MKKQVITDTADLSKINKVKIVNLVRNNGGITRPEISKLLGLSLPTVTRQVESLIHNEQLIRETGVGVINRGRPPKLLEFAGDDHYLIGINMGANQISGILTSLNAQRIAERAIFPDRNHDYQRTIDDTSRLALDLIAESGVDESQVLGVGIAIGGLIEKPQSHLTYSATFNWRNKDIASDLYAQIQKPIHYDHTARVMALGEHCFGIGSEIENFVCILWGYGIGAASIIDGKPYYGYRGMAGEFGHIPIEPKSNVACNCGKLGCLETVASGWAIEKKARAGLVKQSRSILRDLCQNDESLITVKMVADAARQEDRFCLNLLHSAAEYMGLGLATIMNLQNPKAIILGGGLMNENDLFFDRVVEIARQRSLSPISEETLIQPASLGKDSKTLGAVALILNELLNLNFSQN